MVININWWRVYNLPPFYEKITSASFVARAQKFFVKFLTKIVKPTPPVPLRRALNLSPERVPLG
jgi:hypothetical protein